MVLKMKAEDEDEEEQEEDEEGEKAEEDDHDDHDDDDDNRSEQGGEITTNFINSKLYCWEILPVSQIIVGKVSRQYFLSCWI